MERVGQWQLLPTIRRTVWILNSIPDMFKDFRGKYAYNERNDVKI
jgi:hypothetical protein